MLRIILITLMLLPLSSMAEVFKGRLKVVEGNAITLQDGNKKKGTLEQKSLTFDDTTQIRQKVNGKWQQFKPEDLAGFLEARLAVHFDESNKATKINILKKKN
ncbi:hypothetical protein [Paraferrimonas sp. SM1919]|uniref:hypothetical protein n=1 Tax=Paraferrimonas sp. SM1919 TaxID=2662263 RepID=UPI0013D61C78|nr:hypothetical protein [Paraferrimonas sp. SM1919]